MDLRKPDPKWPILPTLTLFKTTIKPYLNIEPNYSALETFKMCHMYY